MFTLDTVLLGSGIEDEVAGERRGDEEEGMCGCDVTKSDVLTASNLMVDSYTSPNLT